MVQPRILNPDDAGRHRNKPERTHGMCRRTHGITRSTHGIALMSNGSARKSPEDPQNAPVEPRSEKSGDLPKCFKQFSNIRGRTRIEPELQGSTTDLPWRSTDNPGSNRSSLDRRFMAFQRPTRESVTGA